MMDKNSKLFKRILVFLLTIFLLTNFATELKEKKQTHYKPSNLKQGISFGANALINAAFIGIDTLKLTDYHVHVVGFESGHNGNFVNQKMLSPEHPEDYLKFKIYENAAHITNEKDADAQYMERLKDLVINTPHHGKYSLLAFDKNYSADGKVNLAKTEFYVTNAYVFSLAQKYPNLFIPVISVHPYRKDALEELTKYARRGGKMVKWLPNSMGIDPSDVKCVLFYRKMKELNLILLCHTGEEKAVKAKDDQKYGNPLLLRKPLDMGVKVIAAHCASLGKSIDLEDPARKQVDNFDLFLRLMDRKKYSGLLFGDISALTQSNRCGRPLKTILQRKDLHPRLVNGSDYPLPAVDIVIRLGVLEKAKYITRPQGNCLKEIYKYNPLLFDFVLKRTVKDPDTKSYFKNSIFMKNSDLEL